MKNFYVKFLIKLGDLLFYILNKVSKKLDKYENKHEEKEYIKTWQERLDDVLFLSEETFDKFLYFSSEDLNIKSNEMINFIGITENFVYFPFYDKTEGYFKAYTLNEKILKKIKDEKIFH